MTANVDDLRAQQIRAFPDHDEHGVAGFVTLRGDDLRGLVDDLTRARVALRHIAASCDTLSPQEFLNVCANGLGEVPQTYAGECDPNRSLYELRKGFGRRFVPADAPPIGYEIGVHPTNFVRDGEIVQRTDADGNRWRLQWPADAPEEIVVKRVRIVERADQASGGDLWAILEWSDGRACSRRPA